MPRIVIVVEGGLVRDVYSDQSMLQVEVIDVDNEEQISLDEIEVMEERLAQVNEEMNLVY